MKTSILILILIVLSAVIFDSCEKMFENPYDENAPKDFWKPETDSFYISSATQCQIFWSQEESHIDGFKIDKLASGNWENTYAVVSKDSLTFIDNAYSYNSSSPVQYSIYAYAINNNSDKLEITVNPTLPTLTTDSVTSITPTTAISGGSIKADGKSQVLSHGVCWCTEQNPTILNSHTNDSVGHGSFTSSITDLTPGTAYYVRAYATNIVGTSYGNQVILTQYYVQLALNNGETPKQIYDSGIPLDSLYGKTYQGGLICYLDTSNGTGLVSAAIDQSIDATWGCYGTAINGADGTAIGTGEQNTIDIEAGCTTVGTAADICANSNLNDYLNWFLPSKDELNAMYINLKLKGYGGFASSFYWSSTEYSAYSAWNQLFSNGAQGNLYKNYNLYVRCVRSF